MPLRPPEFEIDDTQNPLDSALLGRAIGPYAYRRRDGAAVIPAALLAP